MFWRPVGSIIPDGQRFLMLKTTEQAQALTQINVVQNWFEELQRRVPARVPQAPCLRLGSSEAPPCPHFHTSLWSQRDHALLA